MVEINFITLMLVAAFIWPVLTGALEYFSPDRLKNSIQALVDGLEFLLALILSIYLTRQTFFADREGVFGRIYNMIPENVKVFLYGQDVMVYVVVVPLLLVLIHSLLKLITVPLYYLLLDPFAKGLYRFQNSLGGSVRRLMGALSQLPRAALVVFSLTLLLTFLSYYFPSPALSGWMNTSRPYQLIYKNAVLPALNSNIAKQIPVLLNDSFARTAERIPFDNSGEIPSLRKQDSPRVITYFNGVTLDDAIKSNAQIDATAQRIVGDEVNSKNKAFLIYQWISQNIEYDYDKAAAINRNPAGEASGSIIAFNSRNGICFDYASLYISMCRATGVKVRLITGLAYSGTAWGDHAWNQIYATEEGRWINVDPTFGSNGSYFDKKDFKVDHRYAEVQGEW